MSKHTPGPWFVGAVNRKKQFTDINTNSRDDRLAYTSWVGLARAYGCEDDKEAGNEVMEANARLISAAPELLDFAKEWLAQQGNDNNYMTQKAKEAIAKAEGAQ